MKKALFKILLIVLITLSILGADFRKPHHIQVATVECAQKACVGYTIIEAGKGVDCNGDTVRLIKEHGFYELASHYDSHALQASSMLN